MLNVQALTQTLSAMPLNQLQQYAQLHRNDPYVVTMALSIANQKKQAVAAQQGQAGMQPQPKVVDSEIAQMAPRAAPMPEDVGIGQLSAGNMNFANGGIVAFADGGDVERYQYGGMTPQNSMMGDIPGFVAGTGNIIPQQGVPAEEPILRRLYREMSERNAAARAMEERRRVAEGRAAPSERMLAETAATQANPAQDLAQFDAASNLYMTERAAKQAAAPSVGVAPPARTAPANMGIGQLPTGAGAMRMPSQADQLKQYQDILSKTKAVDPAEAERRALGEEGVSLAEAAQKRFEAEEAARGDVYKGREARLSKQESEINSRKATNEGLAFLNAGLAIMSTPGGLAMALGKGARVGTEQYAAGLEKIQAAQDKLGEAQDRLDDLRINRADMTAQQRRALQSQADNAKMDAKKMGIEGIMTAAGVKEKQAATIFDATTKYGITQLEQSGASARSAAQIAAQLNTPDRLVFDKLLKDNNNDPVKALEAFKLAKGDKFDVRSSYADYLKAFAGKEGLTPPMSMGAYAGQFGATLPR